MRGVEKVTGSRWSNTDCGEIVRADRDRARTAGVPLDLRYFGWSDGRLQTTAFVAIPDSQRNLAARPPTGTPTCPPGLNARQPRPRGSATATSGPCRTHEIDTAVRDLTLAAVRIGDLVIVSARSPSNAYTDSAPIGLAAAAAGDATDTTANATPAISTAANDFARPDRRPSARRWDLK